MENQFEIEYENKSTRVKIMDISGQRLYAIKFADQPQLVITRGRRGTGEYFWTSVPEGKQRLAEKIGPLVEKRLKSS